MADFTITISDSMDLIAGEPPNKWGTMLWGDNWGWGQGEIQAVDKIVNDDTVSFSETLYQAATNSFSNSVTCSDDIITLSLVDQAGYNHVFLGNTTDGEAQLETSWSSGSRPSTSWSSSSTPSTTWSDA